MRQTAHILSTYSADTFGVCSALFELGGMVIMHDASGCNSTYTTHDEPRWYDMDSLLYITGLSEIEAIMGDDDKLIRDIVTAAQELHPKFVALCGTPIPTMIGTDFTAVAKVIEARTGIPALGIPTTGMNPYTHGIDRALCQLAERFVEPAEVIPGTANILGLTPLDFSTNGQDRSIVKAVEAQGYAVLSRWAMGSSLEELAKAAVAEVNFVVSSAALGLARQLKRQFGTPFRVGLPMGGRWIDLTEEFEGKNYGEPAPVFEQWSNGGAASAPAAGAEGLSCGSAGSEPAAPSIRVFGEAVYSAALARDIEVQTGLSAIGIDATELWEDDVMGLMRGAQIIIADPMFEPVCPRDARFIGLPHEACSGRIYRDGIPDLMTDNIILQEVTK